VRVKESQEIPLPVKGMLDSLAKMTNEKGAVSLVVMIIGQDLNSCLETIRFKVAKLLRENRMDWGVVHQAYHQVYLQNKQEQISIAFQFMMALQEAPQ